MCFFATTIIIDTFIDSYRIELHISENTTINKGSSTAAILLPVAACVC